MAYLTKEQRKEKLVHSCDGFTFTSCVDLSIPIKVTAYTDSSTERAGRYPGLFAVAVANFTGWWIFAFHGKLNGFPGLDTLRFEFD